MSTPEPPAVPDVLEGDVAWVFGDDFDIDLIVGVQNIKRYEPDFLREVCMADFEPGFADRVRPGDVLVAGRNFGYGHPHYPSMVAMRLLGIAAVVAESYAPGFWRGETFNGMPLLRCPGIADATARGDRLRIAWTTGEVANRTTGATLTAEVPPARVAAIWRAGGSLNLLRREHA
ncbi:LeuD/DmdB family oxidoreductase small subunit, partial [Patulibacter sp. S7RM1-6]